MLMYILNITTNVSETVQNEWLRTIQEVFIPEMLNTKKFSRALLTEVLVEEEMGGVTYSIQFFAASKTAIEAYYNEDQELTLKHLQKFTGKYVDFKTELKLIKEF